MRTFGGWQGLEEPQAKWNPTWYDWFPCLKGRTLVLGLCWRKRLLHIERKTKQTALLIPVWTQHVKQKHQKGERPSASKTRAAFVWVLGWWRLGVNGFGSEMNVQVAVGAGHLLVYKNKKKGRPREELSFCLFSFAKEKPLIIFFKGSKTKQMKPTSFASKTTRRKKPRVKARPKLEWRLVKGLRSSWTI